MFTRPTGLALILGTVALTALSRPASAQGAETGTASVDGEELAPGSSARSSDEVPAAPRRKSESRSDGGGGGSEANDHAQVIGRIGVGWFGVSNIPVEFSLDPDDPAGVIAAPVIGVRYWTSDFLGIDAGIGIGLTGSGVSSEVGGTTMDMDGPSTFGLLLHAGLPMALKSGRHYAFIAVPEINVGFASISREVMTAPGMTTEISNSGFRFDLGVRAGAEVQFGFIGIPELALDASVGIYLTQLQASESQGDNSTSISQTQLSTTSLNNPWDFFRTAVAARYYF
jgi:hypothetical protein